MNKTELIAAVAEKAEISKKDAEKAVKAFTDAVAEELAKGGKVQLVGFGNFEVSERPAREGMSLVITSLICTIMWVSLGKHRKCRDAC